MSMYNTFQLRLSFENYTEFEYRIFFLCEEKDSRFLGLKVIIGDHCSMGRILQKLAALSVLIYFCFCHHYFWQQKSGRFDYSPLNEWVLNPRAKISTFISLLKMFIKYLSMIFIIELFIRTLSGRHVFPNRQGNKYLTMY